MKKSDVIAILIIGEIVAVFFIFILKNLGYFINYLWALIVVLPILALIALFILYLLSKKFPALFQFGKFISVGLANTGVDFGVLNILMFVTGISSGIFYSVFKGVSFIVSVTHSFIWNKFWTFRKQETKKIGGEFIRFFVVSLIGAGINIAVASFVVNVIGPQLGLPSMLWANIGAVCGSIIGLMWNFLGYKFIVFKKKNEPLSDLQKI